LEARDTVRRGLAEGRLVGGCISLLVSTLGTAYEFDTRNSILFLEDVNEPPYRIDRMLRQLWDAGKFKTARGIVLGDMLNCFDAGYPKATPRRVVESVLREFSGPIALGLSSGHTRNPFVTLPIGVQCLLDTRKGPRLLIRQHSVRE
jgi:muramoyltetrapeptide carboxypeptidase